MPTMVEQQRHIVILADFENLEADVKNQLAIMKDKMDALVAFSVDPILTNQEKNEVIAHVELLRLDIFNLSVQYIVN